MSDLLEHSFLVHPDASTTMVGGETVLLQLDSGVYFGLDEIGTKIWEQMTDGRSMADICSAIAEEYEEPRGRIEADVRTLLEELVEANLIVVAGTANGH